MNVLRESESLQIGDVLSGRREFCRRDVEAFCSVTREKYAPCLIDERSLEANPEHEIVPDLLVASAFADVLSDWDLLGTEVSIEIVGPVYVGETVETKIIVDEKNGPRLIGRFYCTAAESRLVIKGTLKGVSIKSVMQDST